MSQNCVCRFRKTKYLCGYYIKYAKKINTRNVNCRWGILSVNALLGFPSACVIYITTFDKISVWSLYLLFTSTNRCMIRFKGKFFTHFPASKIECFIYELLPLNAINCIMSCNESL